MTGIWEIAVWTDRPALPCHPVTVLDEAICGKTAGEKLADVRQQNGRGRRGRFPAEQAG